MADLYNRFKIVCCSEWGIPPWEFHRNAEAGLIRFNDVWETYFLACSRPFIGENIQPYVFRERMVNKKQKKAGIDLLAIQIRAEKNPIIQKRLIQQLDDLNSGGKNEKG